MKIEIDETQLFEIEDKPKIKKKRKQKKEVVLSDDSDVEPSQSRHKRMKCKLCKRVLSEKSMYKHVKLHDQLKETFDKNVLECKKCDYTSPSINLFKRHVCTEQEREESVECELCKKKFDSKFLLQTHMLYHFTPVKVEGVKPTKKQPEEKKTKPKKLSFTELDPRKEKRKVDCPECNRTMASSFALKRHMKMHAPDFKPKVLKKDIVPKCLLCNKVFANRYTLKIHAYTHMPELKNYKCNLCKDKVFPTKGARDQHMQYHSDEKPFKCSICEKSFKISFERKKHMKLVHLKVESCQCSECNKWFTTKKALQDHMRSHSSDLIKCGLCSKKYSSKAGLAYHMKMHKNDKNFKCDVCDKRFYTKSKLNRHALTHTREKDMYDMIRNSEDVQCKEEVPSEDED